jgi:hypothetical protein
MSTSPYAAFVGTGLQSAVAVAEKVSRGASHGCAEILLSRIHESRRNLAMRKDLETSTTQGL